MSGRHSTCTNLIDSDPLLGALGNHGGDTETMVPGAGSSAIDAGDDAVCAAAPVNGLDQRGVPRPQGAHCDIGAVEVPQVAQITATSGSGQSVPVWQSFFNPLVVQVSDPDLRATAGARLYVTTPSGANQASATCSDALSQAGGFAYLYCRANGIAGTYSVEVHADGWPDVAPAVFVLSNLPGDGDIIFQDDFDPPGPRTMLAAGQTDADIAITVPAAMPEGVVVPLRWIVDADGKPMLRVDALRREHALWLRTTRYAGADEPVAGSWRAAPARPVLHVQRVGSDARSHWRQGP